MTDDKETRSAPLMRLTTGFHFDPRSDGHGYLSEAVVAAVGGEMDRPAAASWIGGHNRGVDVVWTDHAVDVKCCFVQDAYGPEGKQRCVGFMGSSRPVEVREGVTHYALVFIPRGSEVSVSPEGEVTVKSPPPTVFLIPAEGIGLFRRGWYKNGSGPNAGHNRYLPVALIDQWRVFGPHIS